MMTFPTERKNNTNVPNHQPGNKNTTQDLPSMVVSHGSFCTVNQQTNADSPSLYFQFLGLGHEVYNKRSSTNWHCFYPWVN
jgi:hypothetical protein